MQYIPVGKVKRANWNFPITFILPFHFRMKKKVFKALTSGEPNYPFSLPWRSDRLLCDFLTSMYVYRGFWSTWKALVDGFSGLSNRATIGQGLSASKSAFWSQSPREAQKESIAYSSEKSYKHTKKNLLKLVYWSAFCSFLVYRCSKRK